MYQVVHYVNDDDQQRDKYENPGRKRAFDEQDALDRAMRVFWENGYSGTSMSDLTAAMGINKPSLYAAFGNKERLFKSAVQRYSEVYGAPHWQKLLKPADAPLAERVRGYLYAIVDQVCDPRTPQGCLFVNSTCESGSESLPQDITNLLNSMGKDSQAALTDFLHKEQLEGNLPAGTDVRRLAAYLLSFMYGLGVLVKSGNSRRALKAAVDAAVEVVPSPA